MNQPGSSDHVINWLQKNGFEVNRENYLAVAFPDGMPEDWSQENEESLPLEVRQAAA